MAALDGKTCVITGATSGIGLEAAARLAGLGARLVLIGRDRAKGAAAVQRIKAASPAAAVDILYADLSSLAGLRQIAPEIMRAAPRIDVLINNAGAIFRRRGVTEDGFERSFALNHLGYYVLTALLRERLAASAPARIVNVASEAHRGAMLDFADLQGEGGYTGWKAYRRSKLCNILFTRELARRLAGSGVTTNCLHPGFVATSFGDNNDGLFRFVLGLGKRLVAISPQQGAQTTVYLASSPAVAATSGLYFDKSKPREPSAAAQDDAAAQRLWQISAQLTGIAG